MNNFLAVSDDSKKFISVILVVLLLFVVLLGIIVESIQKYSKRKAKEIDMYLYDMCKYQLLSTPKDVIKYTIKKEIREFYYKNRWYIRIAFIVSLAFVLIIRFKYQNDYQLVKVVIDDLKFKLESPKSKFFFFDNFPVDWPVLTKRSVFHLDLIGYATYIELIVLLTLIIETFKNSLILKAKIIRVKNRAVNYFNTNIEDNDEKDKK